MDLHSDSEGRELLSRSDLVQNLHLSVREHFEQMRLASFFDTNQFCIHPQVTPDLRHRVRKLREKQLDKREKQHTTSKIIHFDVGQGWSKI